MKRKTKRSKRSRRTKRSRCPFCSWKGGNSVTQSVYATGDPKTLLAQEGAKTTLASMNNMMN